MPRQSEFTRGCAVHCVTQSASRELGPSCARAAMAWHGTSGSNRSCTREGAIPHKPGTRRGNLTAKGYARRPELDHKQPRVPPAVQGALDLFERARIEPAQVDFLAQQWTRPPGTQERRRALLELRFERLPHWELRPGPEALDNRGVVRCPKLCCVTAVSASKLRSGNSGKPRWRGRQGFCPASQTRKIDAPLTDGGVPASCATCGELTAEQMEHDAWRRLT